MTECKQRDCHERAKWLLHWPGDSIPCCDKHKVQIQDIGQAMGCAVAAERITPSIACAICSTDCDGADDWCYGCNSIICEECANRQTQRQGAVDNNEHTLEDHRP